MHTLAWILQGLLAAVFLMAGVMKLMKSKPELTENMPVLSGYEPNTIKLIGIAEVLAAIGLVLPMLLEIMPILTPWAAIGAALVMVLAFMAHSNRGEKKEMGMTAVLALLAIAVAVIRF